MEDSKICAICRQWSVLNKDIAMETPVVVSEELVALFMATENKRETSFVDWRTRNANL